MKTKVILFSTYIFSSYILYQETINQPKIPAPLSSFFYLYLDNFKMMNNCFLAHSECSSSGCESGWTSYLENSYISTHSYNNNNEFIESNKKVKEEEEDLSMVSDASSGPPHDYYIPNTIEGATLPKKNGKREKGRSKIQKQPSLLDDTASSPLLDFSQNNFTSINNQASRPSIVDFSQGYSTTHFQETSTYQDDYGFYYPSLTVAGNPQQHDQWYEEKRW